MSACRRLGARLSAPINRIPASRIPIVCRHTTAHTAKYASCTTTMVASTPSTWTAGLSVARATGNGHTIIAANAETPMSTSDCARRVFGLGPGTLVPLKVCAVDGLVDHGHADQREEDHGQRHCGVPRGSPTLPPERESDV